jgi:hypothetical protein
MLTGDRGQVDVRRCLLTRPENALMRSLLPPSNAGSLASSHVNTTTVKGAKGTPVVRRGRKATGLGTGSRVAEREPRLTLRGGGVSPVIRHPIPDTDESVSANKGKEPSTT